MTAYPLLSILVGFSLTLLTIGAFGRLIARILRLNLTGVEGILVRFFLGAAAMSSAVFALTALRLAGLPALTILAAIVLAVAPPHHNLGRLWHSLRSNKLSRLGQTGLPALAILLAVPFTVVYLVNAAAPETSPDGAVYHLGLVRAYLEQSGFTSATLDMYAALTQGVEMLFLFAFAYGRHSAAALVHLAFLFALATGTYAVAARVGRPRAGALAAVLVFCSPVVGRTATVAYVDVTLAGVLVCLFLVIEIWLVRHESSLMAAAGLLAGFAFAVKYTGVVGFAYLLVVVVWKTRLRASRPLLLAGCCAFLVMLPWLAKNYLDVGNPIAPFGNAIFENPHFTLAGEQDYRENLRNFNQVSPAEIPVEAAIRGQRLLGLTGPVFLLAPLGLLAVRDPLGGRLVFAALLFLIPFGANIGTRFLIPSLPFFALALGMAIHRARSAVVCLALLHAILSWPWVLPLYADPHAWKIYEFPWRAALRLEPEADYLRRRMSDYDLGVALERTVPADEAVFSHMSLQRAYHSRRVAVLYQSALGRRVRDILWTPAFEHLSPTFRHRYKFAREHAVQTLRIHQTGSPAQSDEIWSISEIHLVAGGNRVRIPDGAVAHGSLNRWYAGAAIDGNPATRWSSGRTLRTGEWFEIRLPSPVLVDEMIIDCTRDQWMSRMRVVARNPDGVETEIASGTMEVVEPPAILRLMAAKALRDEGVHWLLISDEDHGSADLRTYTTEWGLVPIQLNSRVVLYRVPSEAETSDAGFPEEAPPSSRR